MQGRALVQYIRGPGSRHSLRFGAYRYFRGNPEGVMVAYRDSLGYIRFGFSFKHSKKEQAFDKPVGLRKAIERAEVCHTADDKSYNIPRRYIKFINEFKFRATERLTPND
jgi:hypothetical protein